MLEEDDLPLTGYIAVVLAGGESRRMGRNKLLMEISARPMIRHVVETTRSVFHAVVVVTGHQHDRVAEALARSPVTFVESPAAAGVEAAVRAGVAQARVLSADGSCKGFVLCIGDQPRLTEREIVELIGAYEAGDRRKPLVPVRGRQRGFPVVLPPDCDIEGMDLTSESVAADHVERIAVFVTKNPVYVSSVDTPEDYRTFFAI